MSLWSVPRLYTLASPPPFRVRLTRAFTLVELLVVIVIIAVLSAIALPVISTVRNQAKATTCLSNLRQMAIGLQSYAAENNTMFPLGVTSDNKTWVDRTIPYLGQNTRGKTVWLCPAAPLFIDSNNTSLYGNTYAYSYSINDGLANLPNNGAAQLRTLSISYPSEVILVADSTQSASNKNLPPASFYRPILLYSPLAMSRMNDLVPPTDCEGYGSLSYHHPNNTCNAAMCDGSARAFKRGELRKKNFAAVVN